MMLTLMNQDDGGRRVDAIGLECGEQSPAHALSTLGSTTFQEPVTRQAAETHLVEDRRAERQRRGHVKWSKEPQVPDVGGLGWRTKTGHLLKNQSYYPQVSKNLWDHPTLAGVNTWKEWHGPRMRADAEIMERLDRFDEDVDQWEAKKTFVNTTRVQTLDRFYGQKNQRGQLQSSSSWAPHRHARREVHSSYETFDGTLDEKPSKVLKKVLTDKVLKCDREAIRQITNRLQNEETWKQVYKQMEQERRSDLRADLQQRQAHTDRLMQLSGQPVKTGQVYKSLNNCSMRTEELAKPRQAPLTKDVTAQTDFRGLIHADNEHALEALFPGAGHELSVEFRSRATASSQPGWPPPPPAETPRVLAGKGSREARLRKEASLTSLSIPSSTQRMEKLGARSNPEQLKQHSKAQFLPTVAPPPPDQSVTLLDEDWSPSATMRDRGRVTGDFARTSHCSSPKSPAVESLPPPRRSTVYPMMAPASPTSPEPRRALLRRSGGFAGPSLSSSASAPSLMSSSVRSEGSLSRHLPGGKHQREPQISVASVCEELDAFEAQARTSSVARISNFFGTPRAKGQSK